MFNTLAWPRSGQTTVSLEFAEQQANALTLIDPAGVSIPYLAEGVERHHDGSLAAATLTFDAAEVPPLGYKTFLVMPASRDNPAEPRLEVAGPEASSWQPADGIAIENDAFAVRAAVPDSGSLESIVDRRTGTELLAGAGNELVIQEEYPTHPRCEGAGGAMPDRISPRDPVHIR